MITLYSLAFALLTLIIAALAAEVPRKTMLIAGRSSVRDCDSSNPDISKLHHRADGSSSPASVPSKGVVL
jgi:hypothetical protein